MPLLAMTMCSGSWPAVKTVLGAERRMKRKAAGGVLTAKQAPTGPALPRGSACAPEALPLSEFSASGRAGVDHANGSQSGLPKIASAAIGITIAPAQAQLLRRAGPP